MSYTCDDLAQAERHVAHGERFVEFQRGVVGLRRGRGLSTDQAELWLTLFEAGLLKHKAERDKIVEALQAPFPERRSGVA
jgi:hypothetical protein